MKVTEEGKEKLLEIMEKSMLYDVLDVSDAKKILQILADATAREIARVMGSEQ